MSSRILRAARWPICVAVVIGATQLPATAQTNDPIRPACAATDSRAIVQAVSSTDQGDSSSPCDADATDGTGIAGPTIGASLDRTRSVAPVYEVAAQRAQTLWAP